MFYEGLQVVVSYGIVQYLGEGVDEPLFQFRFAFCDKMIY